MCMRKICRNSCPRDFHSYAAYSDDHGRTWNASHYLASGTTECQIAELSNGVLYMSIRAIAPYPNNHRRLSSRSTDGGQSWGPIKLEPALVDAGGCAGSVVTAAKQVIYSHPDAGGRSNMTIYCSHDDAESWSQTYEVYSGSSAYSSLAIIAPAVPRAGGRTGAAASASGAGLLFEKDGYGALAFARVAVGVREPRRLP